MILPVYKNEGETPLQCLDRLKELTPEYQNTKMTYAGRLDPMAQGLLLILSDQDVHRKEEFLALNKTYEVDILFGFSTDTYDILGIVHEAENSNSLAEKISTEVLQQKLEKYQKTFMQKYPAYSSKTVQGKPLWLHSRDGTSDQILVPQREVSIYEVLLLKISEISKIEILKHINQRIKKVSGDFRQEEILTLWKERIADISELKTFPIARIKVKCSSGTYMRTLANQIGEDFSVPALAWSITRTELGEYQLKDIS